jgi:hypothetical protein
MMAALKKRVAKLEGPRGGGCDDAATVLLDDSEDGGVEQAAFDDRFSGMQTM